MTTIPINTQNKSKTPIKVRKRSKTPHKLHQKPEALVDMKEKAAVAHQEMSPTNGQLNDIIDIPSQTLTSVREPRYVVRPAESPDTTRIVITLDQSVEKGFVEPVRNETKLFNLSSGDTIEPIIELTDA